MFESFNRPILVLSLLNGKLKECHPHDSVIAFRLSVSFVATIMLHVFGYPAKTRIVSQQGYIEDI